MKPGIFLSYSTKYGAEFSGLIERLHGCFKKSFLFINKNYIIFFIH